MSDNGKKIPGPDAEMNATKGTKGNTAFKLPVPADMVVVQKTRPPAGVNDGLPGCAVVGGVYTTTLDRAAKLCAGGDFAPATDEDARKLEEWAAKQKKDEQAKG